MPDKPVQYDQIAHLPLGDRIDLVCDAFERERRRGLVRPLEDYVQEVPEPERDAFLSELRTVEQALSNASTVMEGEPTGSLTRPLEAPPEPTVPSQLGRYQVEELLGRGGFGEVWRCFDPELHRQVAVKVLLRERFASDQEVARFLSEARKLAQLRHPGIVAIHDVGCQGGYVFLVSEYVPGGTLHDRLQKGPLSPAEAAELLAKVAEAVHYAHKRGLVHRDLKPGNILIDAEGQPRVADFGLAVHEDEQHRRAGEIAGTPAYMAPEQVRGETHRLDGRADIWAMGVILYQCLAGRRPFGGSTSQQIFDEIVHRDPKPLRQFDELIPIPLAVACHRCLAKEVSARYATANDLAADLRGCLRQPPDRRLLTRRAWVCGGGMLLAGATVAGAYGLWRARKQPVLLRQLQWPATLGSRYAVSDDGKSVHVFCEQLGLLQLGSLESDGDLELGVHIRQVTWSGDTGLFLGYQPPTESSVQGRFLVAYLSPGSSGAVCLTLATRPFFASDPHSASYRLLGKTLDLSELRGNALRLGIRVAHGRLDGILINDSVRNEAAEGIRAAADFDCPGPYGLYSYHSTAWFSSISVNGSDVSMSQESQQQGSRSTSS